MDSKTILEKLSVKLAVSQTYEVFPVDNSSCYFGKDNDNNIVFMIPSKMPRVAPIYQETKSLRFAFIAVPIKSWTFYVGSTEIVFVFIGFISFNLVQE